MHSETLMIFIRPKYSAVLVRTDMAYEHHMNVCSRIIKPGNDTPLQYILVQIDLLPSFYRISHVSLKIIDLRK